MRAREDKGVDRHPQEFNPGPIVDDLTYRYEDSFSRDEIQVVVDQARAEIEPISRHPEFLAVLVNKHARDTLRSLARTRGLSGGGIPEILFVCEHNSARSQMAAAFTQHFAGEHVHVRSAGAHPLGFINPLVERVMAERGIELHKPYPKGLANDVLHAADIIVEIGVELPRMPAKHHISWEVADPQGQVMDEVRACRDVIEAKVKDLLRSLMIPVAQ